MNHLSRIGFDAALPILFVGIIANLLPLLGWMTHSPEMTGFGIASFPAWPLTIVANLCLAFALGATFAGHTKLALIGLPLPVVLGLAVVAQFQTGLDFGMDGWMFGEAVAAVPLPQPGRPALIPGISMLLFPVMILLLRRFEAWVDTILLSLGAFLIGIAALSACLLLLGSASTLLPIRVLSAMPCAIGSAALEVAALSWRSHNRRVGMLATGTPAARAAKVALPIIVGVPAITLPLKSEIDALFQLPPLAIDIFIAAFSLSIFVLLLSAAIRRISVGDAALLTSETQMAMAVEAHGIGLFEWCAGTDELRWSAGSERQLGIRPGTLRTMKDWEALVGPPDAAGMSAAMRGAAEKRDARFEFHYSAPGDDGTMRSLEGIACCFYDSAGRLVRTLGAQLDVTKREQRTAELAAREAQMRSILDTVPDAMIIIDEKGTISTFSAAAERMLGYRAEAVIGRDVSMLTTAADAPRRDGHLARYLHAGEPRVIGDPRLVIARHADGSEVPVELNIGEARIDGRRMFTGFLRDISERIAAQERLDALQHDFAHTTRLSVMGELAAGLAHELNQPLAAGANLLGTARILVGRMQGADEIGSLLKMATEQLLRAGEIIRRMRDFIARGDTDMRVESVEETIRDSVALGLIGSAQAHVTVELELDPAAAHMVADRIQIQQVLVNLLRNAAEAIRSGPIARRVMTIRSRAIDGDMLEISVLDRGPGLPDIILNQLYTPFRSTKGKLGLGVGLSICRRIVEAHRGTMVARNRDDGGACVSFTLPRFEAAESEAA